jgi:hypothetical protein
MINELITELSGRHERESRYGIRPELRKEIASGNVEADRGDFVDGKDSFAAIRKRNAERDINDIWDYIANYSIEAARHLFFIS